MSGLNDGRCVRCPATVDLADRASSVCKLECWECASDRVTELEAEVTTLHAEVRRLKIERAQATEYWSRHANELAFAALTGRCRRHTEGER